MKIIPLHGMTNLSPVCSSGPEWYWAADSTGGDLYEAEELFREKGEVRCNRLLLIHYPDGTVYEPVPRKPGCWFGKPVYDGGEIVLLMADFPAEAIRILRFRRDTGETAETVTLPLSSVEDCYNLQLGLHPLTLLRQSAGSLFQIVWPERAEFPIGETESFHFREGEKLFFTAWYEDPDYREETIVRAAGTGEILERFPGDIRIMPGGERWNLR